MTLRYGLGNSVAISTHIGYDGEIGVNTTTKTIHVFDGITEGGTPLAKLSESGGGGGGSQWVSTTTGIHTISNVGIGTTTPRFNLEVGSVGSSGTSLHVNGDTRITGILTIGTSSITLNGTSNQINVGTAVTVNSSGVTVTGVITATSFVGNLTGTATTATTVDITNTNGLTTIYYPTFVENRTDGQILRGDVDLTYRTDTNTLTVPNISATTFTGALTGNVTGNVTGNATGLSGTPNITVGTIDATSLNVSGVSTFAGITTVTGTTLFVKQLNVSGVVTASSFSGSASGLTGIPAGQLTGTLPALDGSALTGIVASDSGVIVRDSGALVGTAATIDFGDNLTVSTISAGIVTITSSIAGINTSGTSTFNNLNVTGVSTLGNTIVGGATTQLVVNGDTRITGILTIGTSSITLNGTSNQINVGTAVTVNSSGVTVTGVITATGGMQAIGIFSGGTAVHTGVITALNFVGTGNTFLVHNNRVDISISGGGGASIVYDATVFAYKNVIDSNIDLDLPHKTAVIYADPDVTVDIESGSTLSVGNGVFFSIIDI